MPICQNQFPTVPPHDGTKVAFVGEAPGRDEEDTGIPFIGKAGQELDRWIRPLFVRPHCFIGNLSQERPPNNKLEAFFQDSSCTKPNERLQHWINVLKEDLEKVKPNIIIALGRHPTFVLTGREANWKKDGEFTWGSVLPSTLVPGVKVMPIPHPAFVTRGLFDLRAVIRVWLRRAKVQSTFPDIRYPYRELVVDPPLEQVMFELDRLMGADDLAFDIETIPSKRAIYTRNGLIYHPQTISCISFSDTPDWAISIPFTRVGNHRWALEVEKKIWRAIARLLAQEGPTKIAHNLIFDFLQLAGMGIYTAPPYWDTLTAHNRAYLDLTKKKLKKLRLNRLAVCTSIYTEEPFYKNDYKDENKVQSWHGLDLEFWKYNAKDSAVLHEIKAAEVNDLKQFGMLELFKKEMRAFRGLACMSLQGVHRDQNIVDRLGEFLENKEGTGRIQVLQKELDEIVGAPLNTKSSPQMQRFLYSTLGLPIQVHPKTKRPTADEGAISKLYQKTKHPTLLRIKELTRLRTFQSNYIKAAISLDGRSRTTYNQGRTSTARLSSSDSLIGEGKNLQTIPRRTRPGEDEYNKMIKEYKRSWTADPGMTMWKRDYIQAEAMVVAWEAEDLQQIDDFLNGIDIHCRTVEILRDIPYDTVRSEYKNGNPEYDHWRNVIGKPIRHGFNYKLGPIKLSQMFAEAGYDVPVAQCKRLLQAMASGVPAVLRWHNEIEEKLRTTKTIINALGLRRTFYGIIDHDTIREAVAFGPQSTVGVLTNLALEKIDADPGLLDVADLLLQIHDAIMGQSPTDIVMDVTARVGELMTIPLMIKGRELTIPSDLAIGPNWADMKEV